MHQRLRAAGVAHSGGLQLDLGQSQHPVAIGRVCDDAPLMHSEESQGLAVPDRLVRGLGAAALMIGAHRILLAVNEENDRLVGILTREAQDTRLEVIPVPPRYPMDPDSLICDLAALEEKSVPAAGLDRAMVFSARLLVDLAGALEGRHPLRRVVTVAGQVERPAVLQVPLGTTMAALVEACGGALKPGWVPFLNGLPGGSRVGQNRSVDQDTEGVLILGRDHPLVKRATDPLEDLTARVAAACASCRSCTDVCTAYLRGRELQPHLIMRTIAAAGGQLQPNGAASGNFAAARHCIGCQLCNTICPTLLRPAELVAEAATRGSAVASPLRAKRTAPGGGPVGATAGPGSAGFHRPGHAPHHVPCRDHHPNAQPHGDEKDPCGVGGGRGGGRRSGGPGPYGERTEGAGLPRSGDRHCPDSGSR